MTISKEGFLYWKRGECLDVKLLSLGVFKSEEDGSTRRFLGPERWFHIVRGRGWIPCRRGECSICEGGHRPKRMVEITFSLDGEPWRSTVPITLNDMLAEKMHLLEKDNLDPLLGTFRIKKVGPKKPYWKIEIL